MNQSNLTPSGERIIEPMIELARCSKLQRIIVAGSKAPSSCSSCIAAAIFAWRRPRPAACRTANTTWLWSIGRQRSIKALETTLDWLVHFLASAGVLVDLGRSRRNAPDNRKLASMLERLGFRVEAGTRCEHGLAVSARRRDAAQMAIAA